jgi:23S rRNA pseudouridine1911/1915/1917 synthase
VRGGERLDAVVARRPGVSSRAEAQRLIDQGRVTVDGAPRPKSHRVLPGEQVEVELSAEERQQAGAVPFEVI